LRRPYCAAEVRRDTAFSLLPLFVGLAHKEPGELCGESRRKVISSRRIKLIRPAVVSRAYFKCHCCRRRCSRLLSLPPIALSKRLLPSPPKLLSSSTSLCRGDPRDGPKAAGKRNAESIERERERERERETDRDCAGYGRETRRKRDVRRNPGTQSRRRAGICQPYAYARQPFDAGQKLPL